MYKHLMMCVLCLSWWPLEAVRAQDAPCTASLEGTIRDAMQQPLPFASVYVPALQRGTLSDAAGHYRLDALCEGSTVVQYSYVGLGAQVDTLWLSAASARHDVVLLADETALAEILVESHRILRPMVPTLVLTPAQRLGTAGQELGQMLEALPGVQGLRTGSSIVKPMIQGLHSDRVALIAAGVRQESQQWGAEHAPTLDPFLYDDISVLKGAGSILYGAGAIGGLILMSPSPWAEDAATWHGAAQMSQNSNGRGFGGSARLDWKAGAMPLRLRGHGTWRRSGNVRSPDYFLNNTGQQQYNAGWAAQWQGKTYGAEVFYDNYRNQLGIFSGAHIGNLTDLQLAIDRGQPQGPDSFSYRIDRPLQRITHETLRGKAWWALGEGQRLSLQYSRQFNRRQEFDAHRRFGSLPDDTRTPQIELELTTHHGRGEWAHRWGAWEGQAGAESYWMRNSTDRGGLIPDYSEWRGGLFILEKWKQYPNPWELEFGLRYDAWHYAVDLATGSNESERQTRRYAALSGQVAAIYRFGAEHYVSYALSSTWRAPNINELYSDGVHHGSASYEKGNAGLGVERAVNQSLLWHYQQGPWHVQIDAFANLIQDFIYLDPRGQGVLTIRGAFPAFDYAQTDAYFFGANSQVRYTWAGGRWAIAQQGALLWAGRRAGGHLPWMPPNQNDVSVEWQPGDWYCRLGWRQIFEQTRVEDVRDYAAPPAFAQLWHIEIRRAWRLGRGRRVAASLVADNLLNTPYRLYLNRFRYFADEAGFNLGLRLRYDF